MVKTTDQGNFSATAPKVLKLLNKFRYAIARLSRAVRTLNNSTGIERERHAASMRLALIKTKSYWRALQQPLDLLRLNPTHEALFKALDRLPLVGTELGQTKKVIRIVETILGQEMPIATLGPERQQAKPHDRESRLQQFVLDNTTNIATVKRTAKVHTPEMQKWRKDMLPDKSIMSRRIEDVLSGKTPLQPQSKRPDPS